MPTSPRNNEEAAIRNLQRYLRQLSYDIDSSIPRPPVDGIFERDIENALRQFQESRGLPITGTADQETWELLYAAYRASLADSSPPRSVSLFPRTPDAYELDIGCEGIAVMTLQHMLTELTIDYSDLGDFAITGTYDTPTQNAVTAFQSHNVLKQTGKVDRLTWNRIADQYNTAFTRYPKE